MILNEIGLADFNLGVSVLFKLAVSIAFVFYIIFSFVIVKQVGKMTETLEVGLEGILRFVAYLHLLFAIGAFAFAFIIL